MNALRLIPQGLIDRPEPLQAEAPMECPRCKELELVRVGLVKVDTAGRSFIEYECGECRLECTF